ncbi:MAG: hypothetical protein FK733_09580 [Asgard group archaeon]|nr:hypothetical protein [Asgard group archaeon]
MKEKKTKDLKKSNHKELLDNIEDFSYEVSSTASDMEIVEELQREDEQEIDIEEEKPPRSSIKIISEKDMEIKEAIPPNYSTNFICVLHFKNKGYKQVKKLETEFIIEE